MAHQIAEGRNLYLRVTEPFMFVNTLAKNTESVMAQGFKVKIMMGGPELFPSHTFENKEISSKKISIFIDSMVYWTRMAVVVTGKPDAESEAGVDAVLKGLEGEIEPH
jgi:hypothetical protein